MLHHVHERSKKTLLTIFIKRSLIIVASCGENSTCSSKIRSTMVLQISNSTLLNLYTTMPLIDGRFCKEIKRSGWSVLPYSSWLEIHPLRKTAQLKMQCLLLLFVKEGHQILGTCNFEMDPIKQRKMCSAEDDKARDRSLDSC